MEDSNLMKLSILMSIVGLIVLFVLTSNFVDMKPVKIYEVTDDLIGEPVKVVGFVHGYRESNGHRFFDLEDDTGKIKIVVFDGTFDDDIENNIEIEIFGNLDEYKGELEIIGKEISFL